MGKTYKEYYERIRIPVPRPGKSMPTEKDYNRKRDKKVTYNPDEDEEEE